MICFLNAFKCGGVKWFFMILNSRPQEMLFWLLLNSLPCFQAILFLQQLLDFQETAGAMLASQGMYMHGACLGMQFLSQIPWTSSLK